jgi:photosystem II stability/assembly factor-like uncharacterized protein
MVFATESLGCLLLNLIFVSAQASDPWMPQTSGTAARLRGLCVVSSKVVWVSGTQGTVLRTLDGGATWEARTVIGASGLDFRDIHAVDDRTAYALSIGAGELSRIYKTTDGGATWAPRYINREPLGFLDALAFWDAAHGIAMGDPVGGRFTILTTDDAGQTWNPLPIQEMPPALAGEGAFAASGTCLAVAGERSAWFGTGGASVARVFRSDDRGRNWTVHEIPIRAGNASSGIFSLAFRDPDHGVAIGGDYKQPGQSGPFVARTMDGGRTWTRPAGIQLAGYRSAVAYLSKLEKPTLVAVGPSGSDLSTDDGETWAPLGKLGFHAVGFAGPDEAGWAVGEAGSIARFRRP